MQQSTESLVLLYRAHEIPYLRQIQMRLQKKQSLQVVVADSPEHIAENVETSGSAILLVCAHDFKNLKSILKTLRQLKESIQNRSLRVLGITDLEDPRAIALLKGRGCMEVYPSRLIWNILENNINYVVSTLTMQRLLGSRPLSESKPKKRLQSEIPGETEAPVIAFDPELESKLKIWMGPNDPSDQHLVEASVVEQDSEKMFLEVDSTLFTEGQEVLLILDDPSQNTDSKFKTSLRLNVVIPTETDRQLVAISIHEKLADFLAHPLKMRQQLQTKIVDFLKAASGR